MPAYHSGNLSQTGRPNFVPPMQPTTPNLTRPIGPRNLLVTSPYKIGVSDVRWDNPKLNAFNSGLELVGVNVYRAIENPYGPYEKINDTPVGVLSYRDETQEQLITEDVTATLRYFDVPEHLWKVYAQHKPIVQFGTNGQVTDRIEDVKVEIDNGDAVWLEVPAFTVSGMTGEITLISSPTYNYALDQIIPPRLPYPPAGKVRITYRYLKHSVLSRLNQRIYYKVTSVAVDPSDPGKRIETPIDEVEWRSTMDIEEIDYMWKEAIRRNRWILEQGGERVKVFTRKWMGERCPEYQDAFGQSKADCETCFPAGTLVRTDTGWVEIEKIQSGDRVLSLNGCFNKVLQTFERVYTGKMVSLLPSVSTKPILATPNHPFRVLRGSHKDAGKCNSTACQRFIDEGDGYPKENPCVKKLPSGRFWARAQMNESRGKGRKTLGTFSTREEAVAAVLEYRKNNYKQGHELAWDSAVNLRSRDWLVPVWDRDTKDILEIEIPQQYQKRSSYGPKRKGPNRFLVNEEFLWIIGLYIAEGSCGDRCVNFSLHEKETEYQGKVLKFFSEHGYTATLRKASIGRGVNISVSSATLAEWFPAMFGTKCYNKQVPSEFMNLPVDKTWALIRGIYDGDGSKSDHEITQTSEKLALQLVELFHRVGEQPLVRQQVSTKLTPKGNKRRIAFCVSWAEDALDHINRKNRWKFRGYILTCIKKLSEQDFSGKVYNLEVESDPSYVVNGVAVHNCFGTSYVGGYSGPIDIIIAPPEAEKTIELLDMGLHVSYSFETWTGPFPILNERDVIVRQTNERFVVGPVNYQGSKGAIYQQHFTISYVDERDIRYKIGISGGETGVPESTDAFREPLKSDASPVIPVKPGIPADRLIKGRTVSFENITY